MFLKMSKRTATGNLDEMAQKFLKTAPVLDMDEFERQYTELPHDVRDELFRYLIENMTPGQLLSFHANSKRKGVRQYIDAEFQRRIDRLVAGQDYLFLNPRDTAGTKSSWRYRYVAALYLSNEPTDNDIYFRHPSTGQTIRIIRSAADDKELRLDLENKEDLKKIWAFVKSGGGYNPFHLWRRGERRDIVVFPRSVLGDAAHIAALVQFIIEGLGYGVRIESLFGDNQYIRCNVCKQPANATCGNQCGISYCDRECQMKDWKNGHKSICYIKGNRDE